MWDRPKVLKKKKKLDERPEQLSLLKKLALNKKGTCGVDPEILPWTLSRITGAKKNV